MREPRDLASYPEWLQREAEDALAASARDRRAIVLLRAAIAALVLGGFAAAWLALRSIG